MNKRWNELFTLRGKTNLKWIQKILRDLNFSKDFKIINIVGTNGKGSTTNMVVKALQKSGKKVGVFSSPHISSPNERISINGTNIRDKDFFNIYDTFKGKQFFSSLFIVAMKYFQKEKVDIAVIEAGVGGKKDSTNAIDGDYGLLTSIGLDHIEYLGDTHQKIFNDKVGIANKGMNFFIPSELPKDIKIDKKYKVLNNNGSNYQERNFKLAKQFLKENFNIILEEVEPLRGRTRIHNLNGYDCIFDVAHNIDGIKATLELLKSKDISFDEVVISMAKRKSINGVFELFGNKKISYFKPDDSFRDFNFKEIKNIKDYKVKSKILFIGSFRLIGMLYE